MISDYLSPHSNPAIVIDGGGLVEEYQRQTEYYRRTGFQIKLVNCRSACTMALSLPTVCVYPNSILKFHAAYDVNTKHIASKETAELFDMYPTKVKMALGKLERKYKTLTGKQLIKLGIRSC